ncbi:MAG: (Fe-S)-binding protein [Desulfobacteraceae bacterium]|nr:MAG: (Fe-S)-binding protein [Desulfobacteraceae bacterium]
MSQKDYSIKEIIQMDACTDCTVCVDVCPCVAATGDGKLSGRYRIDRLRKIMRARSPFLKIFFGDKLLSLEQMKEFSETVFRCTLCGRCQESCPSGILLRDLWLSLRSDLVNSNSYPPKIDRIAHNVAKSHNVFDEDNAERADWVEDMRDPPDDNYIRKKSEVVYFTGCVSAYFPMAQGIPIALAGIFDSSGVDFTLLGEDEWCCGFPLLGAGLQDQFQNLIAHNVEAVKSKGARDIVFACPSCYQMWREHYPPEFNIYHVTQYLEKLLDTGRLHMKELPMTVTYHDPCDLGRSAGEYLAPRKLIRAVPGIRLVEMAHNRENCLCCGGGGNLEMIDAGLSADIAKSKIEEIIKTGAEAVVTACQQCVRTMTSHIRKNKIQLEVLDIVQLIQRATGK